MYLNKVRILDKTTADKIAAGEVIERPASVVKELIENSIDAQSKKIIIEIRGNSTDYIKVSDDGVGIRKEDVEIAFRRYTTSKIQSIDDLFRLNTLGFRGEALSSIALVSHVEVFTKFYEEEIGTHAEFKGGNLVFIEDFPVLRGTTIIVKNLFYNVPARLKFLKKDNVEFSFIYDVVSRLAISYPEISFSLIRNEKNILNTSGENNLLNAIKKVFDYNENDLLKIEHLENGIKIWGYVSKPECNKYNREYQLFFVNRRYIKSKTLYKAVEQAYKEYMMVGKYPIIFLFLDIDPKFVDINIHPAKLDVKFQNEVLIYEIVYKAVKNVLLSNSLIYNMGFSKTPETFKYENEVTIKNNDEETELLFENTENNYVFNLERNSMDKYKIENEMFYEIHDDENRIPSIKIIGQLFYTYIIGEYGDSFYIIDQHAAHERIVYEKLKKSFKNHQPKTQFLLEPINLKVNYKEKNIIDDIIEVLKKIGFGIEEFGENSYIIREVPIFFGKPQTENFFRELIENFMEGDNKTNNFEYKIEKLMKIACKNAVKAKDKLSYVEMERLIKDLNETENPYTCPHGRPIIVQMSRQELLKKFKRI